MAITPKSARQRNRKSNGAPGHLTHEEVDALKFMGPEEIELLHRAVDQLEEEAAEEASGSRDGEDGNGEPEETSAPTEPEDSAEPEEPSEPEEQVEPTEPEEQKPDEGTEPDGATEPQEVTEPEESKEEKPQEATAPEESKVAPTGVAEEFREMDIEELPAEARELIEKAEGSPPQLKTVRKVKGKGPSRWQVTTSEAVWRVMKSRTRWSITPEGQSQPAVS